MKKQLDTALLTAVVLLTMGLFAAHATTKPNIIFILADDLGYGEVGFNGQQKIKTPHLDQMTDDGAVFTDFYAGAPVCGPSRATLLYGQHTGHNPIRGNPGWSTSGETSVMKSSDILLSHEMKRAGYSTAVFGKWGLNEVITNPETGDGAGHPMRQGFDEFVGFNTHLEAHYHWPDYYWDGFKKIDLSGGVKKANFKKRLQYADDIFQAKALDYIDRKAGTEPFFIYLNYIIPHLGHTVPKESSDYYKDKGWPKKKGWTGHYEMDPEVHTAYAGMISRMDGYIGEIFAKLKEEGIAENTLVFFTSDNGHEANYEMFDSNGPLRGKKRHLTEGGIRMPTVVVWPGVIAPGRTVNTPLAFWDVLPTFCEIGGIEALAKNDGLSFYPAIKGEMDQQSKHDVMYWEFNEIRGPVQAIRFGNWKAIRLWMMEENKLGSIQLYNLEADIGEETDLAGQYPEIVQKAENLLISTRTEDPEWVLELTDMAKKKIQQKKAQKKK